MYFFFYLDKEKGNTAKIIHLDLNRDNNIMFKLIFIFSINYFLFLNTESIGINEWVIRFLKLNINTNVRIINKKGLK